MFLFGNKSNHLPLATGPYLPGCTDVMLNEPDYGIFMMMFYPTDAKKNSENYRKWPRCIPSDKYIVGMSKVVMIFAFIIRFILWWSGIKFIPALYGENPKTDKKLPCVIFSHGLGAYRTFFTNMCCELASYGFLVLALEHRDQSACHTYTYATKEDAKSGKRTNIGFLRIPFGKNHYERRNQQVHKRADECSKAVDFLINLNKGSTPYNILDDVPSTKQSSLKLDIFIGKLDINDITMVGHSFGGATALLTLSKRSELKRGILLDPWMFPIKEENLEQKIKQPIQFINTQTFHIKSNVNLMEKFIQGDNGEMMTILHTTHEHQTDMVLLIGSWLNMFMKKLKPEVAMDINNALVRKFLSKHTLVPVNVSECDRIIHYNRYNIEYGLTKPWA